jgi:hypothetical protein
MQHKHSKTVRLSRTEHLAFLKSAERGTLPLVPRVEMLLEYTFCHFVKFYARHPVAIDKINVIICRDHEWSENDHHARNK